jgi:large subunit ribosomal protein L23|tara:strand:- start:113 stop:397 length:285 start_codon:yes stop_codon:yes gene_type:complete
MDLNLIKKPVITEKSTTNAQFNKYVFEVRNDANKKTVKEIIEETYKVKVEKLNSLNVKSKPKVFKGQRGSRSELKRIIVTLKEGSTIDMGAKVK